VQARVGLVGTLAVACGEQIGVGTDADVVDADCSTIELMLSTKSESESAIFVHTPTTPPAWATTFACSC
jgi:hypothetical protein